MSTNSRHTGAAATARARATQSAMIVTLTLVGWSAVPLFLRHFAESIDAWTSNGWRYGMAAMLWAPVLVIGAARRKLPPGLWRAAIVPSIINSIGQVTFTWAHYLIDPGLLAFGLRSQILFVSIGAYLMFENERRVVRSRGYLIGAGLVLLGTVGTISLDPGQATAQWGLGVGLSLASGMFFAMYALSVRRYMHGVHPVVAFSAISQYTAASMVVLMLVFGARSGLGALALIGQPVVSSGWLWMGPLNDQFAMLFISALIGIALGHVGYYTSIARLGVAVTSGVIQLQPFLVLAGSWALFSERMTAVQVASGALAIVGAGVMLRVQHRLNRKLEIPVTALPTAIPDGEDERESAEHS